MQQFQHGQSNPTFLLELPGCPQRMVLRKQPPGKLLASAHAGEELLLRVLSWPADRQADILADLYWRIKTDRGSSPAARRRGKLSVGLVLV